MSSSPAFILVTLNFWTRVQGGGPLECTRRKRETDLHFQSCRTSGYSQVPVFSGKPTSSSSPYFLCSSCLSTGSTRKRHLKNVSSVGGCRHTATPLKLLQWRGLLFDGVVKLPESLESASDHSAPLLHVLPSIPLQTSSFQVDSLSDLPPSLSSTGLSFELTSCVPLSALPPSLSSNDGESLSSSSSFAPSSIVVYCRGLKGEIITKISQVNTWTYPCLGHVHFAVLHTSQASKVHDKSASMTPFICPFATTEQSVCRLNGLDLHVSHIISA
jgi:hypothetical protein